MMMPLLREMPEGGAGVAAMQKAVHTTLFGRVQLYPEYHAQL